METELQKDIHAIKRDLAAIKRLLLDEGELSPWARKALARARRQDPSTYVDLDDL